MYGLNLGLPVTENDKNYVNFNFASHLKIVYIKKKTHGSKCFPFRIDFFQKGLRVQKKTNRNS